MIPEYAAALLIWDALLIILVLLLDDGRTT